VQPTPAPQSEKEDSLPWVELAADTENLTAKSDTDPHPPQKTVVRRPRRSKVSVHAKRKHPQHGWWLGGIGGGVLLALIGIMVWRLLSGGTHKELDSLAARPPLFVNSSGQDNAFRTISQAIRTATDKDHIVVSDDIEERLELTLSKKELVIEAKPGKSITWSFPRSETSGIVLNGVGNLQIRGFTFDGRNLVDQIMLITGHCPGLTLEDIQLRGFRRCGILVANCAGRKLEPVRFIHVQAPTRVTKEAAIAFTVNPAVGGPKINEHFEIRDSRFDGPYTTPIRFGDAVTKDVVLSQNTPSTLNQTSR
jgi:hypothetical protein